MEEEILRERYELSLGRIRQIPEEETVAEPYRDFFRQAASFVMMLDELRRAREDGSFFRLSPAEKEQWNHRLYEDILPGHYETSYGNPAYAAGRLGMPLGKLLCFLYAEIREGIVYVSEGRLLDLVIYQEALIEIYNLFEEEIPEEKSVRDVLYWCVSDYCDVTLTERVRETLDPSVDFAERIIMESDLKDLSYLYLYGAYISDSERKTAEFLNSLPEAAIKKMADTFTEGYIRGFQVMGRDLSAKKTAAIRYPIGFERMIREAVKNFRAAGLQVILPRTAAGSVNRNPAGQNGYCSSSPNRQYDYDHRYDSAVFYDKAFRDRKLAVLKTAYEKYRKEASWYAGPAVLETFGEEGFVPVNRDEAWSFTEKQQKLYLEYRNLSMPTVNEYIPGDETSYTIMAFPVPAIGKQFPEIFEETIRINTLDYETYSRYQQILIDTLDKADHVRILGKGKNTTDLTVSLADLTDGKTQTKFENCVADVNIPLGEVFTSPRLSGTCGVLNVETVYIGEIQFRNLKLVFENGRVKEISCDNFLERLPKDADEKEKEQAREEGKRLVIQQIMNGHEDLPMGEFAIGTNTAAYAMAERFGILDRLPILIVEKMGPHFAVGDTCYSWSEDSPMYNPDGKEMIARDNEISILRKEDVKKAYFGVHTDITIPYKEIGTIEAVSSDGTAYGIIRDGRFVLPGLSPLNLPLDSLNS